MDIAPGFHSATTSTVPPVSGLLQNLSSGLLDYGDINSSDGAGPVSAMSLIGVRSRTEIILVTTIHTVGLCLALVGNCSVIVIIARTAKLHTPSSVLVLMLACSDLLLSLVWNVSPTISTLDPGVRAALQSGAACDVLGFSWQILLTISTIFHSVVALDRYLFIVHPMKYQVYVTAKAITILISCILVLAFLSSSFLLISGSGFNYLDVTGICIGSPIWAVLYVVVIFFPSLSTALFAYQRIWSLCVSVFQKEDIEISHGHTPRVSFSSQVPPLSLSTNSHSKSDLGFVSDVEGTLIWDGSDESSLPKTKKAAANVNVHHSEQNLLALATSKFRAKSEKNTVTTSIRHQLSPDSIVPVENPLTLTHVSIQHANRPFKNARCVVENTIYEEESKKSSSSDCTYLNADNAAKRNSIPKDYKTNSARENTNKQKYEDIAYSQTQSDNQNLTKTRNRERSFSIDSIFSLPKIPQKTNKGIRSLASSPKEQVSTVIIRTTPPANKGSSHVQPNIQTGSLLHRGSSLSSHNPFFSKRTSQQDYETITNKLFGSASLLPSLLYVGVLMPLAVQPVLSNKHRRLRACLLVGLPVFLLIVSFIPFPVSLVYLGYSEHGHNSQHHHHHHHQQQQQDHQDSIFYSGCMLLIKVICHLSYALVPSLTSLLLCLNNRPYRRALRQAIRCCRS